MPSASGVVLAIDAGTTGVRTRAVFADGRTSIADYREFTQHYPEPGWVEHDAEEIWQAVRATLQSVCSRITEPIAAIGITNQRETIVAIDRRTGAPLHRAIVWQDRRTAARCDGLAQHLDLVRNTTGLVLDPYFSGSKIEWLLRNTEVARAKNLAFATIDAFLRDFPEDKRKIKEPWRYAKQHGTVVATSTDKSGDIKAYVQMDADNAIREFYLTHLRFDQPCSSDF